MNVAYLPDSQAGIPPELNGLYVRNGPNSWTGSTDHFFMGDGMLHGIRLEQGQASWYKNRFVQTPLLNKKSGFLLKPPELQENQSNVSLIHHGGKLLSLGEAWGRAAPVANWHSTMISIIAVVWSSSLVDPSIAFS